MTTALAIRWFTHVFLATLVLTVGYRLLGSGGPTYDAATSRGVRGTEHNGHAEFYSKEFAARENDRELKEVRTRLEQTR